MSAWYAALPVPLQALAQNLLPQLVGQGLSAAAAQEKLLAPASRAWLIEQGQQPRPFTVLEDAAAEPCPAARLAEEAAERAARGAP